MKVIIFLVCSFNCFVTDSTQQVTEALASLKRAGNYSSFYELFDLLDNASDYTISRKFKKLIRQKPRIGNLSQKDSEELITIGYNILSKYRKTYDYVLKYHTFPKSSKTHKIYYILCILLFLISLDMAQMFFYYYEQSKMDKKQLKKELKKGKPIRKLDFGELWSIKFLRAIKQRIFK